MKATGIVRRLDELGRVVIPKELRRTFAINEGDPLEIFVEDGGIVFRPYRVGCIACDEMNELTEVNGIALCPACIQKFAVSQKTGAIQKGEIQDENG